MTYKSHSKRRSRNRLNLWRSKQNRCTCISCGQCNIFMMICQNGIELEYRVCWALQAKWYPSVRINGKNPSYTWTWDQVKWRSMSKQNRRCTSMSCWHCNACMIICRKGIAFAGRCTQSGAHQWGSMKKLNTTSGGGYMEVKVKTK